MNIKDKPFSGAYSRRRFSNLSTNSSNYTVQCTSGEPTMGSVKMIVTSAANDVVAAETNSQHGLDRSGSGYPYGTRLKATAEPFNGYRFVQWQTNIGEDNSRTHNYNTKSIEFKVVKNTWLIARFEPIQPETTVKTLQVKWNGSMGRVSGTGNFTLGQGSPANSATVSGTPGTDVTLTATPDDGYRFVRWEGINLAGNAQKNTDARITVAIRDASITAVFAKNTNNGGGGGGVVVNPDPEPSVETPTNTTNGTTQTTTDELTAKVTAFVKKYWWLILIAIYLYYNSKKGGSK